MSGPVLNLFPARVPIGIVQPDGSVLMTLEFSRAMSGVFYRLGGADGMSADDLALLASSGPQPDLEARRAISDLALNVPFDQSAVIAKLLSKVADLEVQVAQLAGAAAEISTLRKRTDGAELLSTHCDPFRVNWERPGRIGYFTANTGAFTALTAQTFNKVTITAPAAAATLTLADGATLTVPAPGGTLGSAAYQNTSAFAASSSTALAPVATDAASTQTLANSLRAVMVSIGAGT